MKKIFLVFIFSCCIILPITIRIAFSQNPLVKVWDKRFGGTNIDALNCFQQTNDGGYILGGWSNSLISGDKSQSIWGNTDFWIVKTDSNGNKMWDKDYGGIITDGLFGIDQTEDGGYILGGYSNSQLGGNKTQTSWGVYDYWIIKIDSIGNIEWDKDFGGVDQDYLYSIKQTSDKGYILGGTSNSDSSGNKTRMSQGGFDYWIIKTDSLGMIQWNKSFGGSIDDYLYVVDETLDKGYILGGYSNSGTGGDKTASYFGNYDYWIIKLDSNGVIQWQNSYGGNTIDKLYALKQTNDNGFILGGQSMSDISGNKSQPLKGIQDYWIIKIDSMGNIEWDKDFGGSNVQDDVGATFQTLDNGYFIIGNSYSQQSLDKSENNLGVSQSWIVKLDSAGNILWDKTIFTNPEQKTFPYAIETGNHCYVIAQSSYGGLAGLKTQDNWDSTHSTTDYWMIKFCDSSLVLPVATAMAENFLCPGTCTDFLNQSTFANTYQWNFPGAFPNTSTSVNPSNICYPNPGNYDVQLIASNANGSDTLLLTNYITVYPFPPAQFITQSGDTLFALAGAAFYQWYYNGSIINGATDYFYVASQSGDYNVVATDSNGCEVEAVINDVIASSQFAVPSFQFAIYPNPVEKELIIKNAELKIGKALSISIYNLLGELAVQSQIAIPIAIGSQLPTYSVDVSTLLDGMYLLELTAENRIYRTKFIKY